MTQDAPHTPVMCDTALEALAVRPGFWYVDGTFGAGGHSRAILGAGGRVLALDRDPHTTTYAASIAQEAGARFVFAQGNFRELDRFVADAGAQPVGGILLDLGVSSMQLDEGERGFAFRQPGPLDMRMSQGGESAADVVNNYEPDELAALIYRYGEERHSRRIARAIAEARQETPITTTEGLADVIRRAYPAGQRREHPARRTFQALRIHVNDELGSLEDALAAAERVLAPGGRLVVLSYHSLEDRIVKHFLRSSATLSALTKKPLAATEAEIDQNPRARSAKLRAAEKRDPSRGAAR